MAIRIGIDFGTTNCAIGRVKVDGGVSTQGPIPSTMAWRNGEYFFGKKALEMLRSDDQGIHPIREVKTRLGSSDIRIGRDRIPSIEAAAKLIDHVCGRVQGAGNVSQCVMATPISSSLDHRKALRESCRQAGIEDMRIVYEPTAALIGAEGQSMFEGRHTVLVVDWGGGTLDLSVIRTREGAFEEIAVGGDNFELGGGRIDEEIAKRILSRHEDVAEHLDRLEGGFDRLKFQIEREKIDVVEDPDGEEGGALPIALSWLSNAVVEMDSAEVFAVFRDFADRAVRLIADVLKSNNLTKHEITHVAFAGGTCNCSVVRDIIMEYLDGSRAILSTNSQILTGEGCTYLVARKFLVELSRGFGFRQVDDSVCVLLPAHHPVEQDSYRQVECLVVDTLAAEAVIECGLVAPSVRSSDALLQSDAGFYPLGTVYVACGDSSGPGSGAERVVLFAGIDRNLAATIYAKARKSGKSDLKSLTKLPLIIRYAEQ